MSGLGPDRRQFNLDAVLVSQEEVEERETLLRDMQLKSEQMRSDTEYNLHRKDTEWGERLKTQKEEMDVAVEDGDYTVRLAPRHPPALVRRQTLRQALRSRAWIAGSRPPGPVLGDVHVLVGPETPT